MPKVKNGLKYCPQCKRNLPITKFGKNKNVKDGLRTYCKECTNKIQRERYHGKVYGYSEKRKLIKKLLAILKPYRKEEKK